MIERSETMAVIGELRTIELVVLTMSALKDWAKIARKGLDIAPSGGMGYASSVGLGLALARPERRVLVLDGDGSLLLNLRTLVTIAHAAPPNLVHLVFENGIYELPGAIPLPGVGNYSLTAMARAAGLRNVYEFDRIEDFRERLPRILREQGPIFICVKTPQGAPAPFPLIPTVQMARDMEETLRAK